MQRLVWTILTILCTAMTPLHAKEWENRKGKRLEGEFVKLENNVVFIRRTKDGEVIRISIQNLSDEDQLFVMDTVEERNAAAKRAAEEAKRKAELAGNDDDDDDGKPVGDDDDDGEIKAGNETEPDKGVAAIDGKSSKKDVTPAVAMGKLGGSIVALIAIGVLALVSLVGWVWLLIVAFQTGGCLWALVCFFCSPIGAIIFAVQHWEEAKLPFLIYIVPSALMFVVQILVQLVLR